MQRRAGSAVIAAALSALLVVPAAQALPTVTKTAVDFKAPDYRYQQVAQGAGAGFEAVGFDDSGWSTGAAGFGTTNGTCSWNNSSFISTPWAVNTDILVRKTFTLPSSASNLRIRGTVDNDATVFVNGQLLGTSSGGFCIANTIDFTAPAAALADGVNLLAVRGHDFGTASYLDQRVTYDVPAYSVCLLYDPAKAHKAGSTVPLKFQLCDENGANVSSESIVVHASGLTKHDSSPTSVVEDSGNANPGDDFRFDAALGGTGGYIFNKSTKGLSTGTWKLAFTVDGDSQSAYELRFDIR